MSADDDRPSAMHADVVPGWRAWSAAGSTFGAFIYHELDLARLALASRIFWPALCWHRDCLFLEDGFNVEKLERWWHSFDGDRARVERMCNHRLLSDLVMDSEASSGGAYIESLGDIMAATWQLAVDTFSGTKGQFEVIGRYRPENEDYELTIQRSSVP